MKNSLIFSLLIHIFFINQVSIGQSINSKQIDSIVYSSIKLMPQVGVAVAVVHNGKLIHSKGYGLKSISTNEKVDEHTLFGIASNSKSFTTSALAILVDEGKLKWEDKVVDYIPEFKMYDPYVTANFNIQDLLTHRSGLGLGAGDLMFFPDGSDFTVEDVLNSFQYQKPVSAFRTKYDYDNLLYVVAGELVARVSGMSWSKYVKKNIMEPLGMINSAGVYQKLVDKSNVAMPHSSINNKLIELETYTKNDESLGAAGGIYSSVNDMSKWLLMHLNDGKYGKDLSKQLISVKNHKEMLKPHTNIRFNTKPNTPYKSHFSAYGLGWSISDMNGYIIVDHGGALPGMLSKTVLIPELNVGVVVLTNSDPGGLSYWTISREIIDAFIGVEQKDWVLEAKNWIESNESRGDSITDAVWKKVSETKIEPLKLKNYVGSYKDNWFGNIEISLKDGELWFKSLRSPKLYGKMFFYNSNTFAVKWNYTDMPCDAFAMFNLDENGQAISIKMKGISPNIDFSFDFQDLDFNRIKAAPNK